MASDNKHWAKEYILDPLNAPEPSAEDGPGTSFRNGAPSAPKSTSTKEKPSSKVKNLGTGTTSSTNPYRRSTPQSSIRASTTGQDTLSNASSDHAPSRKSAETRRKERPPPSYNVPERPSSQIPRETGRPRRSSSLSQRYPGDNSHQPLDTIAQENKRAQRSPHLRKRYQPGTDAIDKLDPTARYHHAGPYDAALMSRNLSPKDSPVAALSNSNAEALKATPRDKINDSLNDHRPLDGTALVPPGYTDAFGQTYYYEEGTDMMRELGGDYKRWPGIQYLPEDLKGKGEPSYSIEKALKEHKARDRRHNAPGGTFELAERPRSSHATPEGTSRSYRDWEDSSRRHSGGNNFTGQLRRRVGSLRRRDRTSASNGHVLYAGT
ncbi:MAG: hypothetical protein M1831_000352 [Alyxoria varia]|nr:MAG: hypothetical protein M1831_000352 [Alyxoria varia]